MISHNWMVVREALNQIVGAIKIVSKLEFAAFFRDVDKPETANAN